MIRNITEQHRDRLDKRHLGGTGGSKERGIESYSNEGKKGEGGEEGEGGRRGRGRGREEEGEGGNLDSKDLFFPEILAIVETDLESFPDPDFLQLFAAMKVRERPVGPRKEEEERRKGEGRGPKRRLKRKGK
jgi:hypothetical protein